MGVIRKRRARVTGLGAVAMASVLAASILSGCGGGSKEPGTAGPDELFGEIASFEILAGQPNRIQIGLSTTDGRLLAGGSVEVSIEPATGPKGEPIHATARFISVPGMPAVNDGPRVGRPSTGTGVYAADGVVIPTAGFWTLRVELPKGLKGNPEGSFEALASPRVPAPGEDAPRTKNMTISTPGAEPQWLDSMASEDSPPDPLLHSTVIADAIAAHRPVIVVVSTPAYCTSRFCGPTNQIVTEFAARDRDAGSDRAYVHLEVWRDYENNVVNKAAAEWVLARGAEGREPWVFLVGRDGKVVKRFDDVVPTDELGAAIDALG